MVDPHQISDSLDTGSGVEIQSSPDSTPPSLDRLKLRLETQELSEEQLLNELESLSNAQLDAEAASDLRRMLTLGEATPETERFFVKGVSILLAQAAVSGVNLNSATELIAHYRSDPLESNRTFADAVASLIGKDSTALGKAFINEYWDKAEAEAIDFIQAAEAAESEINDKESEDADEKSDEEKGIYDKTKDFVKKNKSTIGSVAMIGAIGVGSFYLIHKLFSKKDEGKSEEEKSGFGAKLATAAAVGGFLAGQAIGIKGVQGWIADGNLDSWVYKPWARGWADFVDLEFSNAFDYWTGNGPTSSERSQFESMSKIFDVSESILWSASKVSYGEFMSGDSGTWNPFHKDEEEKLRKSLKDYYVTDLERIMPELKDPEKAKNISLREVLLKGFRSGAIRSKDTTGLSAGDREQIAARYEDDTKEMEGTALLLAKPKENIQELQRISHSLKKDIEALENTGIDAYYDELLLAFESAIGCDFDFGTDDEGEYKDMKLAREKFMQFFETNAKTDKEFFAEKKGRLTAFSAFLETHKDEDPWSESTQIEYAALKEDFTRIQENVLRAKSLSEQENLDAMRNDKDSVASIDDLKEGITFSAHLLSGGLEHLMFRLGAVAEGDVTWITITIAQVVGVMSEFVGKEAPKHKVGFAYRVVKGATFDPIVKPLLVAKDARKIFVAFKYTPEQLAMDFFKGNLTATELQTRIKVIKRYETWYKASWVPLADDLKSRRSESFKKLEILESETTSLKTIHDYLDGKLTYGDLADDTKKAVDLLTAEQKAQVNAYRVLRKVMTIDNRVFDEVLSKLKDPSSVISPKAQLVYEGLDMTDELKTSLQKTLNSPEDVALVLADLKKISALPTVQPEFVETTQVAGVKSHKYQYGVESYTFTEDEIGRKAGQIAEEARKAGTVPASGETAAWHESNWNKAISDLSAERYATPVKVSNGVYKFGANTFKIPDADVAARLAAEPTLTSEQAIRRLCIEQATSHINIEAVEMGQGKYRYKLNGEWLEFDKPIKPSEVKAKFQEVLGSKMKDFDTFAANARSLRWFNALEKLFGTAGAVYTIYELETATDKRKAIAEISAGLGSFWAGMQLADWTVGRKLSGDLKGIPKRMIIDLMGGLAAVWFGAESVESIITSYYKDIPASYGVSDEMAAIFEKQSTRMLTRASFASLESGLARKGIERMGMKGLTSVLEKKVGSNFMKKLALIAAKKGFRDVLGFLGVRGVVVGALLADNATVIGVADDIIAVGLGLWMAADVIQILKLIANAKTLQDEMSARSAYDVRHFEIREPVARAEFQKRLVPYGCTLENAHEKLSEETFFDILRGIDNLTLVIARTCDVGDDQSFPGFATIPHEEWTLHKGEAIGMTIFKEGGSVLCELTDEDAKVMDEKLTELEQNGDTEN